MSVDPTDIEPSTFLAKQAVRSVARLGAVAVDVGRSRLRARELEQLLKAPTYIEELAPYQDELRTGDSSAIVEFLAGDEVERLLQWVAALQVTDKWSSESEAILVGRLSGGILRYTKQVTAVSARAIAAHVGREIVANISDALGTSGAFATDATPKTKRVLAKNAALVGRLSLADSAILNDLASSAAADSYIDAVLRSVQQATTKSKMPHLGNLKSVPLAELYVAPNAVPYRQASTDRRFGRGDILSVGRQFHRLVVLGDPGGGKTTTSRRMMNIYSGEQLARRADRSLTLMIVLRDWAEELSSGKMTVVEVLHRVSASRHSLEPPEGVLESLLESGRVKVFFDGLDELLDTADRHRVVDVVEGFVHRFPLVPVIVTSRRVGYPQAPLDGDLFNVVEISGFVPEQRKDYVTRWFSFEDDLSQDERGQRAESFIREAESLNDIASNPLMLSLMCALYSYDQYIPRNRPEVYEKCSRLMFDSWDRNRGIRPTLSFQSHMMGALDALALYMYGSGLNEAGLTRALLVKRLAKYLKKRRFRTFDEARAAAANFVDHCSGRAWILSEVSPERYTFTHATFIEYFAARQLTRQAKNPKALAEVMRQKVLAAEWDVVCQLAVQIINDTEVDGSDKAIRALLKGDVGGDQQEANLLSFIIRCFAFYVPSPRTLDAVADRVVALLNRQSDPEFETSGSLLVSILDVSAEIRYEWLRALAARIEAIGPTSCSSALRALVVTPMSHSGREGDDPREDWREALGPIREEWRRSGVTKHLWCALAGPLSSESVRLMVQHHGVEGLFADSAVGNGYYLIGLASRVLRSSASFDPLVLNAYTEEIMAALDGGGQISAPSDTPFAIGLESPDDERRDVEAADQGEKAARLLAAMGLLELAGDPHGLPRDRVVSLVFSGGEASLEGGSLRSISQLDLPPKLQDFAERWVRDEVNMFADH
ncbi:NACHT domain-containing protein [Pedococcus dokdonensis]|uniref:NACHT domain-containing protein n=1 Tax=Pedococcus dokdonensis TaxID=443156 RepID=A0A1H0S102_9MICO|nr:NACHT domain-containing protein [Pedococcus dokdonensis]SDP35501.1 NACHT domain-containing protein [Pedococcus dokdonensis]